MPAPVTMPPPAKPAPAAGTRFGVPILILFLVMAGVVAALYQSSRSTETPTDAMAASPSPTPAVSAEPSPGLHRSSIPVDDERVAFGTSGCSTINFDGTCRDDAGGNLDDAGQRAAECVVSCRRVYACSDGPWRGSESRSSTGPVFRGTSWSDHGSGGFSCWHRGCGTDAQPAARVQPEPRAGIGSLRNRRSGEADAQVRGQGHGQQPDPAQRRSRRDR